MNWLPQLKISAANRQQWMAGMLLGLFLSVFTLTLSETLHHEVHDEAEEAGHQCAVTMLQSGQVEVPLATVAAGVAAGALLLLLPGENNLIPSVDLLLPPSCGPPALLS